MPQTIGDVEAASDFVWQVLFLSPIELVYIGITMTVLATYGLSIYFMFKKIQKKFKIPMKKQDCFLLGTIFKLHGYKGDVNIYNDKDIPLILSEIDFSRLISFLILDG